MKFIFVFFILTFYQISEFIETSENLRNKSTVNQTETGNLVSKAIVTSTFPIHISTFIPLTTISFIQTTYIYPLASSFPEPMYSPEMCESLYGPCECTYGSLCRCICTTTTVPFISRNNDKKHVCKKTV